MRQLSGRDAAFLYSDTIHSNANISLLHIHDQSTAPGGVVRFKSILAHVERRLNRAPLFRQRLLQLPARLDRPYWVDDPHFDLEYHVRHLALPKPGDWRQFCIQAARIHSRALDLGRPLWELYVIEGLDSFLDLPAGSFALLLKTHLAAVDLDHLGALGALFYDPSPNPPPEGPPEPWFADSPPCAWTLVGHGLTRSATAPLRLALPLARLAMKVAPAAMALASEMLLRPRDLPVTRFNAVVSPHRVFETRRFTEAEFESIRSLARGASLDDAVIAVCGGALRRYLDAQGELPEDHSLAAIVPVPDEDAAADRNAPSWRHVLLGTEIADPLRRLKAIRSRAREAPDPVARVFGSRLLAQVGEQASAIALAWGQRVVFRASAYLGRRAPPANCTLSTLAHPAATGQPLYLCGAKLTYFSAMLPIIDGLGLALAVTRCDGRVVISPTSCRELMPDPEFFAQCLRDSFLEYLALAQSGASVATSRRSEPVRQATRRVRKPGAVRPASPRGAAGGRTTPTAPAA